MVKIKVKKSKLHGKGVFALENIPKGKTIELCNIILLDKKDTKIIDKTFLYNYYFAWKNKGSAIALGNGSLYNHSYEPNAEYDKDFKNNSLAFISIRSIKKGEEIVVNYNGNPNKQNKIWFDK